MFLRRKIDEKSRENQQSGEAQDGGQQAPKSILTLLKGNRGVIIRSLVILQTYLFLACSLAIFAIAHTFGKAQQVNRLVFLVQILPLFLAAYSVWSALSNFCELRCNNKKAVPTNPEADGVTTRGQREWKCGSEIFFCVSSGTRLATLSVRDW